MFRYATGRSLGCAQAYFGAGHVRTPWDPAHAVALQGPLGIVRASSASSRSLSSICRMASRRSTSRSWFCEMISTWRAGAAAMHHVRHGGQADDMRDQGVGSGRVVGRSGGQTDVRSGGPTARPPDGSSGRSDRIGRSDRADRADGSSGRAVGQGGRVGRPDGRGCVICAIDAPAMPLQPARRTKQPTYEASQTEWPEYRFRQISGRYLGCVPRSSSWGDPWGVDHGGRPWPAPSSIRRPRKGGGGRGCDLDTMFRFSGPRQDPSKTGSAAKTECQNPSPERPAMDDPHTPHPTASFSLDTHTQTTETARIRPEVGRFRIRVGETSAEIVTDSGQILVGIGPHLTLQSPPKLVETRRVLANIERRLAKVAQTGRNRRSHLRPHKSPKLDHIFSCGCSCLVARRDGADQGVYRMFEIIESSWPKISRVCRC